LNVNLTPQDLVKKPDDPNILQCKLLVTSALKHDNQEVFSLESTYIGIFTLIPGEENMTFNDFTCANACALMFPYIREHITSISIRAAIKPIILQPINLLALFNKT